MDTLLITWKVEFVILLFAAWRLGATITPVNPGMTGIEVDRQLSDSGARLLVVEDEAVAVEDGVTVLALRELRGATVESSRPPHLDPSALALLMGSGAERRVGFATSAASAPSLIQRPWISGKVSAISSSVPDPPPLCRSALGRAGDRQRRTHRP